MINHFGLDIGSHTVKVVQLALEGNALRLVSAALAPCPPDALEKESEKDFAALAETIKKLIAEAKISSNEVMVAIPEREVFTRVFDFPKMEEGQLDQAIPWEAENLIPKPLSEVNLDWQVIEDQESQKEDKVKILLVASPTELVNKYLKVLKLANLIPLSLETELLATIRVLKTIFGNKNFLVANLGFKSVDIAVVKEGNLSLSYSLPAAGEAITRNISSSLGLDLPVAEEYKKTYGLSSAVEGKVGEVILPILAVIVNEIKKAIRFYEEKEKDSLKLIVLSGGTSLLPGLPEYLARQLGIEVQIADPFSLISGQSVDQNLKKSSPLFTVAFGLAIKET